MTCCPRSRTSTFKSKTKQSSIVTAGIWPNGNGEKRECRLFWYGSKAWLRRTVLASSTPSSSPHRPWREPPRYPRARTGCGNSALHHLIVRPSLPRPVLRSDEDPVIQERGG